MTDRYDQDMILGYVEGDLSDEQRAAFEATLADDHELRQLVSQMRLDREALRSLARQSAPVGLVDQVMQAQERDALLGDPAAPEPLPLVVPMSRRKIRRVLAYSAVAAVLLLSFSVVLMTLTPPDLLNNPLSMAQNETRIDPLAGTESGLARVDEDAVYDNLGERALAGRQVEPLMVQEAPPVLAMKEKSAKRATVDRLAFADAEGKSVAEADAVSSRASSSDADRVADAVGAGVAVTPTSVGGFAAGRVEPTTAPAGARVAMGQASYAGYDVSTLPEHMQLEVDSASPTQARRDIRDWAIANSARVVEEPARVAGKSFAVNRRSRGMVGGLPVRGLASAAPPGPTDLAEDEGATSESQLVLFVDDHQVPSLLAYLNRGRSQRADVVPIVIEGSGGKSEAIREARLAKKADRQDEPADAKPTEEVEHDDTPPIVALSNRLVDLGTAWRDDPPLRENSLFQSNLQPSEPTESREPANTLAPGDTSIAWNLPDVSQPLDNSTLSKAPNTPGSNLPDTDELQGEASHRPLRLEDFFDWSKLSSPATQPAVRPASPPKTLKQRRLQVVIRQVAEDTLRVESDAASGPPTHDDGHEPSASP